jgi:uncharacterized protein YbaP (TraB family)
MFCYASLHYTPVFPIFKPAKSVMKKILLFPLLFFAVTLSAQKQIEEKTLLWRISGNGVKAPSYLFGTMHLRDSRLFNFYDSLYTALEQCDRFAMEIQPDSLTNGLLQDINFTKALFNRADEEDDEADLSFNKYIEEKLTKKEIDSLHAAAKAATGADKINYRKLIARKRLGYGEWEGTNNMPVFMDAWLFNVARKQGKEISGLENLADHLRSVDSMKERNIQPDILFSPRGSQFVTEGLISVYLQQEVQKMYDKIVKPDSRYEQELFNRRNMKMLTSIEKTIVGEKLFIAVGAAHLAGDSGLIWLLRSKGYTVEPVYSTKRKAATDYKYTKAKNDGYYLMDTVNGYSLNFPYKPADINMLNALTMHIYTDLGSGLGYLSLASEAPFEGNPADSAALKKFLSERLASTGRISAEKYIRHKGITGIEGFMKIKGIDESARARVFYKSNVIYIFLIWAGENKLLKQDEAETFFASATFYQPALKDSLQWEVYKNEQFGFSVMMPGKPEITDITGESRSNDNAEISIGVAADLKSAIVYMFTCTKLKPGYYYPNDTLQFNDAQQRMMDNMNAKLTRSKDSMVGRYRARRVDFELSKGGEKAGGAMLIVSRTGMLYVFMVMKNEKMPEQYIIDKYFNSLAIRPYAEGAWEYHKQDSIGIEGWLPGLFVRQQSSDEESYLQPDTAYYQYNSFNKAAGQTYYFYRQQLSPYFWAATDSALWEPYQPKDFYSKDSLLSETNVSNGNAWGKEWWLLSEGGSVITRKRVLFCGDKRYEIFTHQNAADTADKNANRFFNELRITDPMDTAFIRTSKAALLLKDLRSADSVTREAAKSQLQEADFARSDLPLLYNALMYDYGDSSNYYFNTSTQLVRIISSFKDDTTTVFAERNYRKAADVKGLQYQLLGMILASGTQAGSDSCKKLLLDNPPVSDGSNVIMQKAYDSLQLFKSWFPEMLTLADDQYFRGTLWSLTEMMLDSNLVPVSMILPYADKIYRYAAIELDSLKANDEYYGSGMDGVLGILGYCNTKKGNELLKKGLPLLADYLKKNILISLARNNVRPADTEINKLAANDNWRYQLYEGFKRFNKTTWFPVKYTTQLMLAKSRIFYAVDEEEATVQFAGEKTALFEGKQQRFYLFRITFGEEEEAEKYLGVCGPFSMDKKDVNSSYKVNDVSDEPIGGGKLDVSFKAIISRFKQ